MNNFLAWILVGVIALALTLWVRRRLTRHREEAAQREADMLAATAALMAAQGKDKDKAAAAPEAAQPDQAVAALTDWAESAPQAPDAVAPPEAALQAAQAEAARIAAEATAKAQAAAQAQEAARLQAERERAAAAARAEAERLAAEEAQRLEAQRLAAEEAARVQAQREAAEQAARLEAQRQAAEAAAQAEAARAAAEAARLAAEAAALREAEEAAREAARRAAEAEREAAQRAEQEAARLEEQRRIAEAAAAPVRTRKLLPEETIVVVADDSKVVRVKINRLLAQHRYRAVLAESAEDAIAKMEIEPPHVLITDVEMPGMDGFGLTRHVRANARLAQLPVIMITSSDDRQEAAKAAGVSVLLGKPYSEEKLIACIEDARNAVEVVDADGAA